VVQNDVSKNRPFEM